MESRNQLGIYIRQDRATVVCLRSQGRDSKLQGAFSVRLEDQEGQGQQALADQIGQVCRERGLKSATAIVALDCALFMQHAIHSDFSDFKKIAATVRFDTEEALATDVSDMAVAFRVTSTDDTGANLDVFTAQRSILTDILLSLKSNGIDPVAVVPDAYSLLRYVCPNPDPADEAQTVFGLLSDSRGYFVGGGNSVMRAFLVNPSQDRQALLSREAIITKALAGNGPLRKLCVADVSETAVASELAERVSLDVESCDLPGLRGLGADAWSDCPNAVDFAVAYGAALPESEKDKGVNFRNDHMPYLGKKLRFQKAARSLSIALTLLLLAVGVYTQMKLMIVTRDQTSLRADLEPEYLAVMPGAETMPSRMTAVVKRLQGALRGVEAEKGGRIDPKSLSAKLTMVLQALNACAAESDLKIDVVTLSPKNITITGDTSSRRNTLKVFDAMEKAGLTLTKTGFDQKGDRDTFTVAVEPKGIVQ